MASKSEALTAATVARDWIQQVVIEQPINSGTACEMLLPRTYARNQSVHLPAQSSFWTAMTTYHNRAAGSVPSGAILFLGDSHIQGLAVLGVNVRGVNLGIGGDTMRGLINRTSNYEPLSRAGAVVIQIGTNDFWAESSNWVHNVPFMMDKIFAHFQGGPVVISSIPPVSASAQSGFLTQANINTANGWLATKAALHQNVIFVETATQLKDSTGHLAASYSLDGIHLNTAGQQKWSAAIKAAIQTVVAQQ